MIKLLYLDEEQGWQSTFHTKFTKKYDLSIPEFMPQNIDDIWPMVGEAQVVITDYRLNGNGDVAYTGDDVARMIHRHNKHLPVFIITSYEDNAIQECTETQIIRGKEMFTDFKLLDKLCLMIEAAVNRYDQEKAKCESCICAFQEKIKKGEELTPQEDADRFDAELYLSELDLDSSCRSNLMTRGAFKEIEEMISLARAIVANHK